MRYVLKQTHQNYFHSITLHSWTGIE